jgi:hypothetical protein
VRREQSDHCQRNRAIGQRDEDDRTAPDYAGGFDPAIRGVLGQIQHLRAVDEQRRTPLREIELARIELGQPGDEGGRCPTSIGGSTLHVCEELFV